MNQHPNKVFGPEQKKSANGADTEKIGLFPKENQLQHLALQAMIGRITPEVIHDINNHLTGILGYAELLLMKKVEDPSIRNGLKNILLSAEKSKVLLDSLLVLSHQETSAISVANVNILLEKTLDMRSCALRHRQIEYNLELGKDLPSIVLDGAKFQKAVLNLIFKAEEILEDHPPGKRLVLMTVFNASSGEIIVNIINNDSRTSTDGLLPLSEMVQKPVSTDLGTNLGLADACRWIETLGGTIEVEHVKGKGTTFSIHLPLKREPEA